MTRNSFPIIKQEIDIIPPSDFHFAIKSGLFNLIRFLGSERTTKECNFCEFCQSTDIQVWIHLIKNIRFGTVFFLLSVIAEAYIVISSALAALSSLSFFQQHIATNCWIQLQSFANKTSDKSTLLKKPSCPHTHSRVLLQNLAPKIKTEIVGNNKEIYRNADFYYTGKLYGLEK